MLHRSLRVIIALALLTGAVAWAAPSMARSPGQDQPLAATLQAMPVDSLSVVKQNDRLSGAWRISRVCLSGCVSPPAVIKVVRPRGSGVFTASGHGTQILYQIGNQVLVHGGQDSSLLTVQTPGRLMKGVGVGADGQTFTTIWECVTAAAALGLSRNTMAGTTHHASGTVLAALEVC